MQMSEFLQRKAADVMVTELITLNRSDMMAGAAHTFSRERISGAPVIDDNGKCLGVLSVTDVVGAEERVAKAQQRVADDFFSKFDLILPMSIYEEELNKVRDKITPVTEQPVENFMATDVVTVNESTPLVDVVRLFVDSHIHRVVVTDDEGGLRGIISTIDVMSALLRVPAW